MGIDVYIDVMEPIEKIVMKVLEMFRAKNDSFITKK